MDLPVIETPRLRLRPRRMSDLDDCLAMDRTPGTTDWITGPWADPLCHEAFVKARIIGPYPPGQGYWVLSPTAEPDRFLGWVLLIPEDAKGPRTEIGWRLMPEARGKGFATEAGTALAAHGFALGIPRIVAEIHRENAASRHVAEKIGMRIAEDPMAGAPQALLYHIKPEVLGPKCSEEDLMLSSAPITAPTALIAAAKGRPRARALIVGADHPVALESAQKATDAGLIEPVLIGNGARIAALGEEHGWDISAFQKIDATGDAALADAAAAATPDDSVKLVMKGQVHTDALMGALLRREAGVRIGQRMSHIFHMTIGESAPLLISDGALNVAPDAKTLQAIAGNLVALSHRIGRERPKIACLSATEEVLDQMPSSVARAGTGRLGECPGLGGGFPGTTGVRQCGLARGGGAQRACPAQWQARPRPCWFPRSKSATRSSK